MTADQHAEYAVEVQDVGYACGAQRAPFNITVGAETPDVFDNQDDAQRCADKITDDYRRLGQPDMADKVVIHVRIVTTARDEWSLLGSPMTKP
jgi:hypothetical protein